MLTLSKALKTGRLQDFIRREEERGIGPVDRNELDAKIERLATTPVKSKDRTSHSTSGGGLTGK